MNILILNWRDPKNPKSGGAEYVTFEHAKAWVNSGNNVTWFTSNFENGKKQETMKGVKFIRRGSHYSVYLHAPIFYIANRNKFDFIVDEIHGIPFFTPFFTRKPKVAFIHEVAEKIWDSMYPFPVNLLGKLSEYFYLKIYKDVHFWTDADSTIDDLTNYGVNRLNCVSIPCPIRNKPLETLPEKEKIPTFIFVSRVVKMKGVEDVIKAFFHIIKNVKDAQLWIVGDGDEGYIKYLKETMNKYCIPAKVRFFGKISEKKKLDLMRRSHLLLHASIKEGWGLVVIEAASQATPSIVYNVNGLRDSVINHRTGIVIKKNVPEEMAKEAIKLIADKVRYKKMQKEGLKRSSDLKWEDVTAKSLKLIEKIASSRK